MENNETEYKTLKNKLRYYERMINNNIQLTSKQEMKYNEYKQQIENIDYTPRAKMNYEEYKRVNCSSSVLRLFNGFSDRGLRHSSR